MNIEELIQQNKELKEFAYFHLALAHELSGHVFANGVHKLGEIPETLDMIRTADVEFEAYIKNGTIPDSKKEID